MQFTTVRSKEKDYDISLKSEKLVHSQQEHKKNVSQLFASGKNWFLAISSLTNTVAAIWREKKVDPCYLETIKCSSQLLRARKMIMPAIWKWRKTGSLAISSTDKHCLPAITSIKSQKKLVNQPVRALTKNVSQLFGECKKWIPAIWRPINVVHNCQEQGKRL